MHQAVYLAIGALLFALSVWAFRIIYLESGGAASSGSGQQSRKSSMALSTAIVLVITVMQLYRVAQDPSRTFSWVVLGVGLIACVLTVVGLSRRRASHADPND
jgi:uncharacterized membrane protein